MDFHPSAGSERPGLGSVAALCAFQFAIAFVAGLVFAFIPGGGSGLGAVAPLSGAMGYAIWAEGKVPGGLTPRLTRLLAFYATVVSVAVSALYVAYLVRTPEGEGLATIPVWGWALILVLAGAISFLISWFGLAQGRRIAERARRKRGGPDAAA
jgi:hypothetical protein